MTTLDPAVQAQLQQIASGGLPPQAANALLQAGKINYGQYQQAVGMPAAAAPAPAPIMAPAAPAELPMGGNADPATANMTPDQIAALDRVSAPKVPAPAAPSPAPGAPAGGISFHPAPSQPGDPSAPPAAGGLNLAGLVAAPGGAVPAAWVPRGRETQTQSGVAFSPETQAALQKFGAAGDQLDDATRQSIETQQRQDAMAARLNADQAQADLASFQNRKAKQDSDREWSWNQIASAQRDMEETQAKGIDPHHWWNEKSTGSKILMGIGMIAAGFNQGTGHGPNGVLDTINKEIDRDVDAQKENAAGKDKSLQNKMALYGLLRQKGLDEDASADGAKILAHQNLDAQLKSAQADAQSPLGKMQLAKAIQDNQQKIATLRAGFDEKAANKSTSSQSDAFRPASAGVGAVTPQAVLKAAQTIYEKNLGKAGNDWNQAVRLAVRGLTGKDTMPGAAEPIITDPSKKGSTGRMGLPLSTRMANVRGLDELAKLAGGTFESPGEAARANQLLATLKANGVEGLPESIGSVNMGGMTGSTAAAIDQARKGERQRVNAMQSVIAGGGGGDEGDGDAPTPAGFEGDE